MQAGALRRQFLVILVDEVGEAPNVFEIRGGCMLVFREYTLLLNWREEAS